jgi:hypothetical protein
LKSHPEFKREHFSGMSDTDDPDRIPDDEASFLLNGICDPTGKVTKWPGTYPVTMASELGVASTDGKAKVHCASRFRGKTGIQRAVAIVGGTMLRTGPNNIYQSWVPITFPTETSTPVLDRVAEFVFRNRYCYHQNGVDLPFRVKMEEDDGSAPTTLAEILGLPAPLTCGEGGSEAAGTRFPANRRTGYAMTFVYGDRGESGPSPIMSFTPAADAVSQTLQDLPLGPTGVTARRLYRTKIGHGKIVPTSASWEIDTILPLELFFLAELTNTGTTFADTNEDSAHDYSRRLPPPRPMVPVSKYQKVHQDRIVWANLIEHPWVMSVASIESNGALTAAAISISNTGNGTITLKHNIGAGLVTIITVANYKTKSLKTIQTEIMTTWSNQYGGGGSGSNFVARVLPGVDRDRTYRFKEVTDRSIYKNDNVFHMEAIDDTSDAVVVDGQERFPNRVMFSNLAYPEEINPLNFVDVSRHDVYPITGTFRDDYTFGIMTENDIWLLTGSFSVNPETFAPDFSLARSQSEHGSFCTRPDAIAQTPGGLIFVAKDGLRLFRGQNSTRFGRQIRRRLMERILIEPRARENLCMLYESGRLYIAFAGREVA